MQVFARSLFLLARQAGAVGLRDEARRLFAAARDASGSERAEGLDFRAYGLAAALLGWTGAGKLSCWADRFRASPRRPWLPQR